MSLNRKLTIFEIWREILSLSSMVRIVVAIHVAFVVCNKFFSLSVAYFVSAAIADSHPDPIRYSLLFFAFKGLEWLSFIFQDWFFVKTRNLTVFSISEAIFDKILRAGRGLVDGKSSIEIFKESDVRQQLRSFIGLSINHFLSLVIDLVLTGLIIYSIAGDGSAYVMVILMATLFVMIFLGGAVSRGKRVANENWQLAKEKESGLISSTKDLFSKIHLAKSYNAENLFLTLRKELSEKERDVVSKLRSRSVSWHAQVFFVSSISFSILFMLSVSKFEIKELSPAAFAALITIVTGVYWKLQQVTYIFEELSKLVDELAFGLNIYASPIEKETDSGSYLKVVDRNELVVKNVSFSYGEKVILKNVSFNLINNESLFLVGHSGAGKSTLFNLLLSEERPSSGEILWRGKPMEKQNDVIAWVPQDCFFKGGTLDFNLSIGKEDATDEEKIAALKKSHVFDRLFDGQFGLERIIDNKGLSGGELQRISIARAYLSNRPLVLMDEPTSALDARLEREFFKELMSVGEQVKIIIIHRVLAIPPGSKIIVLSDGEVSEFGSLEELLDKKGIFYSMYKEALNDKD